MVGLAGLGIGCLIATRQIRATTVSSSRKQWIQALQDVLCQFIATIGTFSTESVSIDKEMYVAFETAHARLSLMLRTDDANHCKLQKAMRALMKIAVQDKDERLSSFPETREAVFAAAREVIDAEWAKIKHGK